MISLVFDTETTGLIDFKQDLGHKDQPDILQLCAHMEEDGKTLSKFNFFVHGEKEIEEKAFETHRIDRKMTGSVGITRRTLCYLMNDLIRKADTVVGHNIDFDMKMMLIAMRREGGDGRNLRSKAIYCTMKNSMDLVKIPHPNPERAAKGEYKWPSLMESYKALVDPRGFDNAHDAEADVLACSAIYNVIRQRTV